MQVLPENRVLRTRMISFLHRLVECLGDRLLPYLPSALSALLPLTADASTVSDVCALLSQLAIRYKAALAPLLAEVSCKPHLSVASTHENVEAGCLGMKGWAI